MCMHGELALAKRRQAIQRAASSKRGFSQLNGNEVWGWKQRTLLKLYLNPLPSLTASDSEYGDSGCLPHASLCAVTVIFTHSVGVQSYAVAAMT